MSNLVLQLSLMQKYKIRQYYFSEIDELMVLSDKLAYRSDKTIFYPTLDGIST